MPFAEKLEGGENHSEEDLSKEERHFSEVVESFRQYSVARITALEQTAQTFSVDYSAKYALILENQKLLDDVITGYPVSEEGSTGPGAAENASKARSTLHQFAREWSALGAEERNRIFEPIISSLKANVPSGSFVLCPGCGLGRLPFDMASEGYNVHGNEFSYHMLLGSDWALNRSRSITVYPYVDWLGGWDQEEDSRLPVKVPDVDPSIICASKSFGSISMIAGEFAECYGDRNNMPMGVRFNAVVTCFFIDTAKNILQYIRCIANMLQEGCCWINCGPLLYHFHDSPGEVSIELSAEELRIAIQRYFTLKEDRLIDECKYCVPPRNSSSVEYTCWFFCGVRNNRPVEGVSLNVYS